MTLTPGRARWLPPVLLVGIALGIASPLLIYQAIRVNSTTLIDLQQELVDQLRRSTAHQATMLYTLESLHQQQERYLGLLTRLADLEQRIQSLTEQNTVALYHLIRTAEVAVYVSSLPDAQKPVMSAPTAYYRWMKDAQDQDD